nr:probable serine/threonine-protein phosphatase 2A regulatory subunit B'' subunit TON2 [Tanacetum cinerariifolium]
EVLEAKTVKVLKVGTQHNVADALTKVVEFHSTNQGNGGYIGGLIPNLAQLRDMPAEFIQMYYHIATHRFFFFCDPSREGLYKEDFAQKASKTIIRLAWEMDFESFLDITLALENRDTPEGLTYIFWCLDLHGRGYLIASDIHILFRDVHEKWVQIGNYELCTEDVRDEIWNMVKPAFKEHTC